MNDRIPPTRPLPKDPEIQRRAVQAAAVYVFHGLTREARRKRVPIEELFRLLMLAWNERSWTLRGTSSEERDARLARALVRWRRPYEEAAARRRKDHPAWDFELRDLGLAPAKGWFPRSKDVAPALLSFRLVWGEAWEDTTCTVELRDGTA